MAKPAPTSWEHRRWTSAAFVATGSGLTEEVVATFDCQNKAYRECPADCVVVEVFGEN